MGEFVTGDTGPDLTGTIHDLGTDPDTDGEDLTGATVRFQMRKANDKFYTVDAAATLVNALTGKVKYVWAANDLNVKGTYQGRWEVTYPSAKVVTTKFKTITVVRQ